MSKQFYETLSKSEQAHIVSMIKSLNQRMTDLEKHGMTNTIAYKNLQSFALVMNPHNKGFVDGIATVRAKQTYKITAKQYERLVAIKNNPNASRGGEVKRAKELFKQSGRDITTKEAEKFANDYGDLHEFITTHQDAYYGGAGNPSRLENAVHRSSNLTLDEVEEFFKIMTNVETETERNRKNWVDYLTNTEGISE